MTRAFDVCRHDLANIFPMRVKGFDYHLHIKLIHSWALRFAHLFVGSNEGASSEIGKHVPMAFSFSELHFLLDLLVEGQSLVDVYRFDLPEGGVAHASEFCQAVCAFHVLEGDDHGEGDAVARRDVESCRLHNP